MEAQMTGVKTAAVIVSAVIAAAVFTVALYWRWEQRRRDREALLAYLEQYYSEKVQPASAYMSALTRRYPGADLWDVLLAGVPPELQQHAKPGAASAGGTPAADMHQIGRGSATAATGPAGHQAERPPVLHVGEPAGAAGSANASLLCSRQPCACTHAASSQLSDAAAYQAHQLTKACLDFMVAEEQARNIVKGFWVQLLGAMQRGDLPASFGIARPALMDAARRRPHAKQQQAAAGVAYAQQQPLLQQPAAQQDAGAQPAGGDAATDVEMAQPAAAAHLSAPAGSKPARSSDGQAAQHNQPLGLLPKRVHGLIISLWPRLAQQQLQPGTIRFKGVNQSLWTARAHNFLQLVEPFDIANFYRIKPGSGRHYNDHRPDVFWQLDEMCQHEARARARLHEKPSFKYSFSREWADHMQHAGADQPPTTAAVTKLDVPVAGEGRISAANLKAA